MASNQDRKFRKSVCELEVWALSKEVLPDEISGLMNSLPRLAKIPPKSSEIAILDAIISVLSNFDFEVFVNTVFALERTAWDGERPSQNLSWGSLTYLRSCEIGFEANESRSPPFVIFKNRFELLTQNESMKLMLEPLS